MSRLMQPLKARVPRGTLLRRVALHLPVIIAPHPRFHWFLQNLTYVAIDTTPSWAWSDLDPDFDLEPLVEQGLLAGG